MSKKDKNYIENYIKSCVEEEIEQLDHDFFSKDLMDYIDEIISNKFMEYLKSGQWKNDIDLYVDNQTYSSVREALGDWVNKDLIIEHVKDYISYELKATIDDLKSLKQDISDGCLQKLFYDKFANPDEKIKDLTNQVFRMQKDIMNLSEKIIALKPPKNKLSRNKLNDFG
jgi:hypothetical protein